MGPARIGFFHSASTLLYQGCLPFRCRMVFHGVDTPPFVYPSSMEGQQGHCQLGAAVNNVAVNICMQSCGQFSFLSEQMPKGMTARF